MVEIDPLEEKYADRPYGTLDYLGPMCLFFFLLMYGVFTCIHSFFNPFSILSLLCSPVPRAFVQDCAAQMLSVSVFNTDGSTNHSLPA